MSTWTHINGSIRVDYVRIEGKNKDFSKIFISSSWEVENPKCNMPLGSEGSLQYKIIVNPKINQLAAYIIVIYGDLRDYGIKDINEIKKWFKKVLKKCGIIRQATLEITCEDSDITHILSYDDYNSVKNNIALKELSYKRKN